jgi:glycosyltransferase involved in cell wall biosynthesis
MLSVIIPVYDEEDNLVPLFDALEGVLEQCGQEWEVLFVDDGSTDSSPVRLAAFASRSPRVKVITFRRNFGQTAAIMAGIDHAAGDVLIAMDADGQNDPADIPLLLEKLEQGFDVVSGWRRHRRDRPLRRVAVSRVANFLISRLSGVQLHDYGCTLKAYRRDVVKGIRLYGEMHRFIPIYASWEGGRVTEIPVRHRPRLSGASKYGLERVLKVVLDLIVVQFLGRYETKPIYVFGAFSLFSFGLGLLSGLYAVYLRLFQHTHFIRTPLPLLVVLCALIGAISLLIGLLAEILIRTYFEAQGKRPYAIRQTRNLEAP